jgi:hypothetical protein
MAKYASTILAAALVAALAACSSTDDDPVTPPATPAVVFAAGSANGRATIWQDGVQKWQVEASGGKFYSIWVTGTAAAPTVHAVGQSSTGRPLYWRSTDGAAIALGSGQGTATAVCVEGGNVYVAGDESGVGKVWSGSATGATLTQRHTLPQGAMPWAIAVSGNNVYTAGDDDEGACVWRDGGMADYLDTEPGDAAPACFWAVGVSGSNVYAAGECDGAPVWLQVDGDYGFLGDGDGLASSLHITGGSLHVAGWDALGGKVWRGAPGSSLSQVAVSVSGAAEFESVRVLGSDVYTGGWTGNAGAVWKNGTQTPSGGLGAGSDVLSVFVVAQQ